MSNKEEQSYLIEVIADSARRKAWKSLAAMEIVLSEINFDDIDGTKEKVLRKVQEFIPEAYCIYKNQVTNYPCLDILINAIDTDGVILMAEIGKEEPDVVPYIRFDDIPLPPCKIK